MPDQPDPPLIMLDQRFIIRLSEPPLPFLQELKLRLDPKGGSPLKPLNFMLIPYTCHIFNPVALLGMEKESKIAMELAGSLFLRK